MKVRERRKRGRGNCLSPLELTKKAVLNSTTVFLNEPRSIQVAVSRRVPHVGTSPRLLPKSWLPTRSRPGPFSYAVSSIVWVDQSGVPRSDRDARSGFVEFSPPQK